MRILWLSDFYPPLIGGLERHVQMIASELASRGHAVSVATIWHAGMPSIEVDRGVRVYRLIGSTQRFPFMSGAGQRKFHPTAPDPFLIKKLVEIIDREKPDIVIASGWILYSFLAVKSRSNARLFVRHHDYAFICPKRTLFLKGAICSGPGIYKCYPCTVDHYGLLKGVAINTSFRIFRHLHGLVDQHLPVSQYVAEAINKSDALPPASIHVIPAPVPDDIFEFESSSTPSPGIPETGDYILYVGALTQTKGLNVLLDAYRGLENRVKLLLVGTEWPDSPSSYPEGVMVIKNAAHSFVMEAFSRCLFSVVPSLWAEPFGQVAVEAMAAGKPVIASAHGGLLDIVIHRTTGILVEPGNTSMLNQAMIELLDNAALRRQLGAQGYSRAIQRFTCTQVTNQFEAICGGAL
jgi:glycosyltransferase involved in cell wall biosynthesis